MESLAVRSAAPAQQRHRRRGEQRQARPGRTPDRRRNPCAARTQPMNVGMTSPARLPHMLMSANPVASAAGRRNVGGSVQKVPCAAPIARPASNSVASASAPVPSSRRQGDENRRRQRGEPHMPVPLLAAIRMPGIQHHAGGHSDPRQRGDEADLQIGALRGQVPDDLRQPVQHAVRACHEAEPAGARDPQSPVPQRESCRRIARALQLPVHWRSRPRSSAARRPTARTRRAADPAAATVPRSASSMVGVPSISSIQRQPGQPDRVVDAHQPAGERSSANRGDGNREHERRDRAGAISRRNPLRQVEHDAWRKTALGDAKQQAQRVEGFRGLDEGEAGGGQSPDRRRSRKPSAACRSAAAARGSATG